LYYFCGMSVRLIIVEDDNLLRQQITSFLDATPDFDVIGSYASAEEALAADVFSGCHIMLTDIELPGISGIDLIQKIKEKHMPMQCIVLTVFEDDEHVFSALRSGAVGYLLKGSRPSRLLDAIDEVISGGSPMSGNIARRVIDTFRSKLQIHSADLTERENNLLGLLAEGFRYKEIAEKAEISVETVRTHIRNIYHKLQVQSRTEAINKVRGQ
jgi:DNA-binding NarL/FixJ family response regulator